MGSAWINKTWQFDYFLFNAHNAKFFINTIILRVPINEGSDKWSFRYHIAGNFREHKFSRITNKHARKKRKKNWWFLFSQQGHNIWPHTLQFPAWKWWPSVCILTSNNAYQTVLVAVGEKLPRQIFCWFTGSAAQTHCVWLPKLVSIKFLEEEIFTGTNFHELAFDRKNREIFALQKFPTLL